MVARIGFDVTAALMQGGGIGRYTRELIHALTDLGSDYQFKLFSARPPKKILVPESIPEGVNVAYRPAPLSESWLYRLWFRARIPWPVQFFVGSIDLFHSPDFVLPPVIRGIPTILTVHDLSFVHYPETFPERLVSYLNQVVPRSVSRADHILADSISTKRDLAAIWQVPPEKVTVLYSGVNERFSPQANSSVRADVRQRYGLDDKPFILTVGTVQPRKNYDRLVRAFSRFADRVPHNLVIAGGKGWLFDGLLQEIERHGLADRVRLIGFVADEDLPALYSTSDLFVFPSLYEGFGLPLLEAMACGVPVIASDASSLPEVVESGDDQAALLISPLDEEKWAERMEYLLFDDSERQRLIQAGFRQAGRFRWHTAAKHLLALYSKLLAGQVI